jgi:hypothetical protein
MPNFFAELKLSRGGGVCGIFTMPWWSGIFAAPSDLCRRSERAEWPRKENGNG